MEWRPIADYDAMPAKPKYCIFRFLPVRFKDRPYCNLPEMISAQRYCGHRVCDVFLVLPLPPFADGIEE